MKFTPVFGVNSCANAAGDHNLIADRFRRYLAASSALARVRAFRALADDLRDDKGQAGQAEAACIVSAASAFTSPPS
jgi:hypothetical protein